MPDPSVVHDPFRTAVEHHRAGRTADAEASYRQVLSREGDHADASFLLGLICHQSNRSAEAEALIRRAISFKPDNSSYLSHLGIVLSAQGRADEAISAYSNAIAIKADAQTFYNLGNALALKGELRQAIEAYRNALKLQPDFVEALNNLGQTLQENLELDEAMKTYRQALALRPDSAEVLKDLGNALKETAELDEAMECYRRAESLAGDARTAGNLLYCLYFHPDYGPAEIHAAHRRWNDRFCKPLVREVHPHVNDRPSERPLRIGYVSPDFNSHPVGRFLAPLLAHHDHSQFEIFCYSDLRRPDPLTIELKSSANVWRETWSLSDERLAALIREDRIDILVDLTMHMKGSRLLVFARKPAPVQVTYLAYCGTTGAETIDYRLTDPFLDLNSESIYVEKSFPLRQTYWCYRPHYQEIPVAPPPMVESGRIAFGCLNSYSKVNRKVLSTWAAILRLVPNSRLIVHTLEGSHRQKALEMVRAENVDPNRIQFVSFLRGEQYFHEYDQIDIALDSFPYPGGTTTCDALWMGVPVVSLAGQTAVSRAGLSLLSNLNLSDLVASSTGQYIQIASELAGNGERLSHLRSTLRQRMLASPLMDGPQFARDVEAAYRKMWHAWCIVPQGERES